MSPLDTLPVFYTLNIHILALRLPLLHILALSISYGPIKCLYLMEAFEGAFQKDLFQSVDKFVSALENDLEQFSENNVFI